MNKLEQAARQALEALAGMLAIVDDSQAVAGYHLNGELEPWEGFPEVEEVRAAITALREALEAAPEPAAIPAEWLEEAFRDGWAMCRDSKIVGEEEEDWAFANSTTNSRMIDAQQAAPQPAAAQRKPWKDGDTAALVNALRDVAVKYHASQQLRERIAELVRPLSQKAAAQPSVVGQKPVSAIHLGWDRLDNGQLVATYFLPVAEMAAPKLYTAPQPARQPLTDVQVASACISYRQDFGRLSKRDQEHLCFQAREWDRAISQARGEA